MALTSLIYTNASNVLESVAFDATFLEQFTNDVDVTDHPVETGANITDHVRQKPATLRLAVTVTDYPVAGGVPTFGTAPAASKGRAAQIYTQLQGLQSAATVVEVWTARREYPNMIIQNIDASKDNAGGRGAIKFTMTLREIRYVDSQLVPVTVTNLTAAKGHENGGPKTAEEAGAEKKKSLAARGFDAAAGAIKGFLKTKVQ